MHAAREGILCRVRDALVVNDLGRIDRPVHGLERATGDRGPRPDVADMGVIELNGHFQPFPCDPRWLPVDGPYILNKPVLGSKTVNECEMPVGREQDDAICTANPRDLGINAWNWLTDN